MDIQYAILGLLNGQPLSGYDLKKIIAESELFYWSGNNNQIYNSLVALHRAGLVTQDVQPQAALPARKVYTITEAGRAALRAWLLSEPELPEARAPFLIRLAFTGPLDGGELLDLLARYEDEVRVRLQMLRAAPGLGPLPAANNPRQQRVLLRVGEALVDGWQRELDWARALRAELEEMQ